MNPSLDDLRLHPSVSSLRTNSPIVHRRLPTGFPALDEKLAGGGWPLGAVTEIVAACHGVGELHLVMAALAQLSREGRWLVWIAPPYIPYAPALADYGVDLSRVVVVQGHSAAEQRWAAEQALRSSACGAVLQWAAAPDTRAVRRLQLAAEQGRTWAVVFLPARAAQWASLAALRLYLAPTDKGLEVQVLKCRGQAWRGALLIGARHAAA